MALLTVKDLNVHYDAIHAIKGVNFEVNEGEIVTLIGANGAGKTSIMHSISGLVRPSGGFITFNEIELVEQVSTAQNKRKGKMHHKNTMKIIEASKIVGLGLAQVPEGRRVFSQMTVKENLQMGAYSRTDKAQVEKDYKDVLELLPRMKERRRQMAGTLSGGEQQMLAIGRALMSKPKMLLLDEPSMGLSPLLVKEIFKIIQDVNASGMTVLLVEQNAKMALEIANRAYVLETGKIVMQGDATKLANNDEVRKAYLGS